MRISENSVKIILQGCQAGEFQQYFASGKAAEDGISEKTTKFPR